MRLVFSAVAINSLLSIIRGDGRVGGAEVRRCTDNGETQKIQNIYVIAAKTKT